MLSLRRMGMCWLWLLLLTAGVHAQRLAVTLRVEPDGTLRVRERWTGVPSGEDLSRTIYLEGWSGRLALRQRITGVEGPVLSRLPYGYDRLYLKLDSVGEVDLTYHIRGAARSTDAGVKLEHTVRLYDIPFSLRQLTVELEGGRRLEAFVWNEAFSSNLFEETSKVGRSLVSSAREVPAERAVRLVLEVPEQMDPLPFGKEFAVQFQAGLGGLALGLVGGILLAFTSARTTVAGVRLLNFVLVALVLSLLWPLARFDIVAPQYEGVEWTVNLLSVLVIYPGLAALLVVYVARLDRALVKARPEAYFLQIALPVVLFIFTPAAAVEPSFLVLPAAAGAMLLAWSKTKLGHYLGASSHLLVEHIRTQGELTLTQLADWFGVSERRLRAILHQQSELPVIVDFEGGVAYSPATAALKADLTLCTSCGGATRVKGQQVLQCPYCGREYATSRQEASKKPVPTVVEAYAQFFRTLGIVVCVWTGMLMVVGFLDEWLKQGLSSAFGYSLIVLAVGAILGLLPLGLGEQWRKGRSYGLLRWTLGLLTPAALATERVRLHFGLSSTNSIEKRLKHKGALSLEELARELQCSLSEAGEVIRYLVSTQQLNALYDRVGEQLVARDRFEELASHRSCGRCGGFPGLSEGRVVCQNCGSPFD